MLFYTESPLKFAFSMEETDFTEQEFTDKDHRFGVVGVPFDSTTTYKPCARFGPRSVREASYNFERYNFVLGKNLDAPVYDFGDVEVAHGSFKKTCKHVESTISEIEDMGVTPITIGGEHSISYGVLKAIGAEDVTVIHLDAHMDLRNTYMGEKYSHATVMRRISDLGPEKIIQIGVRSASQEETVFAQETGVEQYTAYNLAKKWNDVEGTLRSLEGPVYVTVDLDVLDPAYAPSVGTPAPCGLSPQELEKIIFTLKNKEVIGLDLVEISSTQIGDLTSVNGAKVIYDFLSLQ